LQGYKEIFRIYAKKMPIEPDFDLDTFAEKLEEHTGAEIAFVALESAYNVKVVARAPYWRSVYNPVRRRFFVLATRNLLYLLG
jgi:hypothetical protein